MNTDIYTLKGTKAGTVELPDSVFGLTWNRALMHQVITAMQANARTPVAHTKNRGDVSGGGKKPWQQKGTGRARHGSSRSPLWKGGGVTHGPINEKDYSKKLNKKVKAKALAIALSQKMRDGEILFVDAVSFASPSASDAKKALGTLGTIKGFEGIATRRNNAALLALSGRDINTVKSFGNFGNVEVDEVRNLNPVDVLKYKYLIITNPKAAVEALASRMDKKEVAGTTE
jgi:large subunit ribosomal protein L4